MTFWELVREYADKKKISSATYRSWMSRGFVPPYQAMKMHLYYKGTKNELPLEMFLDKINKK